MKRMKPWAFLIAAILLAALPIMACVASVGVSVPIGSPYGYGGGGYGSIAIGSGPIYF